MDVDDSIAARLGALMGRERYLTLGGNPPPAIDWYWMINPEVAKFTRIRTTLEFFSRRAEIVGGMDNRPYVSQPTSIGAFSGVGVDEEDANAATSSGFQLVHTDSLHREITNAVIDQVSAGHQSKAILQAALAFRDVLRRRTGLALDGTDLINQAFGKMRPVDDTRTGRNQFQGTKSIALGMMQAYRNSAAHQLAEIEGAEASEAIATFSLLARNVERFPVGHRE
jgi:uncharacterized protein (TIGR02391 family)